MKRYKFRKNGKTISLHIHNEVNSWSQKLKVNQVDSRVAAGQRFFSWRSFPWKSQTFIIFSAQRSLTERSGLSCKNWYPKELIHCCSFCLPQNETVLWQCLGLLLFMQQVKRIHLNLPVVYSYSYYVFIIV